MQINLAIIQQNLLDTITCCCWDGWTTFWKRLWIHLSGCYLYRNPENLSNTNFLWFVQCILGNISWENSMFFVIQFLRWLTPSAYPQNYLPSGESLNLFSNHLRCRRCRFAYLLHSCPCRFLETIALLMINLFVDESYWAIGRLIVKIKLI